MLAAVSAAVSGCMAYVPMAAPDQDLRARALTPTPQTAVIYLYRDQMIGYGMHWGVTLDGQVVGNTAAQTYMAWTVSPGRHVLVSETNDDSRLELVAAAGHRYFVWQDVTGRPRLQLVSESRGRDGLQRCKLVRMPEAPAVVAAMPPAPAPAPRADPDAAMAAPSGAPTPGAVAASRKRPTFGIDGGFGSAVYQLKSGVMANSGIGRPVPLIFSLGVVFAQYVTVDLGGGLTIVNDKQQFCESSIGCSSVSGGEGWIQAGGQYPFWLKRWTITPGLSFGYHGFGLTRGIDNCANCDVESVPLSGGAYLAPSLKILLHDQAPKDSPETNTGWGVKVAYERPLAGDLSWGVWFQLAIDLQWW